MILNIDNREPIEIKEKIKSRIENINLKNLEIGDFEIVDEERNQLLIFERKSLEDLVASIKDGRYEEQSLRLSNLNLSKQNIYYIIEGNLEKFQKKNDESRMKMVYSAIYSLSNTKNFNVLNSNNENETSEYIIRFYEKLKKNRENKNFFKMADERSYINVIKSCKKENITKENINEIMLCQIPGISPNISKQILFRYKTIYNLINILSENKDDLLIYNKELKEKKEKILNKKVIENINNYLL